MASAGDSVTSLAVAPYYSRRPDPQRGEPWPADSDEIVRPWIESLRRCGMQGLILDDGCSEEFCERWAEGKWLLGFQRIDQGEHSCNDDRFAHYLDLIEECEGTDWWLFTDLADVEFHRNPFEFMADAGAIYLGSEHSTLKENNWIRAHFLAAYGKDILDRLDPDARVLNAGIIGGHRYVVGTFVEAMVEAIDRCHELTREWLPRVEMAEQPVGVRSWIRRLLPVWERDGVHADAPCLQAVAPRFNCVTGHPLHTRFRANEGPESGACIRHK